MERQPDYYLEDTEVLPVTVQETEAPQGELAPARQKRNPLAALTARLPRFSDPVQKRAGGNVIKFLAIMLILTLVARGTAAATLAAVKTAAPNSAEVVEAVKGSGTVSAAAGIDCEAPEGLTIEEMLAAPGQKVQPGDSLARFDPEEVADALAREQAKLKELELKLTVLGQSDPVDDTALRSAQKARDRAQQAYDEARTAGDSQVSAAQTNLNNAVAERDAAAAALAALPPEADEEQRAAAQQRLDTAQAAIPETQAALDDAIRERDTNLKSTGQSLDDAKEGIADAQKTDEKARRDAANTTAQNAIDAEVLRLDIAKQQDKVTDLTQIQKDGNTLLAAKGGTVTAAANQGEQTDAAKPVARLADAEGGFEATASLPKAEAEKLAPGAKAEVTTESGSMYYTPTVEGTVTAISEPDEAGNCKVMIRLPQGDWKHGQSVQINMVKSRETYYKCVPVSAVRSNSSGNFLLVMEQRTTILGVENVLVEVPVTVTASDDKNAAVDGMLDSRAQVVTSADKPVEAGSRVRVGT